jgi:hypothetical protein
MKKYLYFIPEVYFTVFSVLWMLENYNASGTFNYFAAVVAALMLFQVFFKKRILGIVTGGVLALFSVFMMLAVRSEFNEFQEGSPDGLLFLLRGEGLFLFSMLMAIAMVILNALNKPDQLKVNVLPA